MKEVYVLNLQENLKFYREKAGYKTAKEFSNALGIPYNTYTAYENQKREPKLDMLLKIADLLRVSLDDLLGRELEDENKKLKRIITNLISLANNKLKCTSIDETTINFVLLSVKSIQPVICPVKKDEFIKFIDEKERLYEHLKKKSILDDLIMKLNCFTYTKVDKEINNIHKKIRNLPREEQTKYLDEIYNRLKVLQDELTSPKWEKDDINFFIDKSPFDTFQNKQNK